MVGGKKRIFRRKEEKRHKDRGFILETARGFSFALSFFVWQ